ncbi:unnamed protein product [Brachionus calyciflorus]|uniref:Transmembrane protein 218 n=1 Tax=Brachionus calyciflorus TaxID=104777 RepID=A0A813PI51_9BILA|nr:unnamed protein product [Brachionus calyciflorus]
MVDVGAGVIILAVLWIFSFICLILLCGTQGKIKFLAAIPSIISLIVTIILLSLPRGSIPADEAIEPEYKYSYTSLIWILILTSICFGLVVALGACFVLDLLEPRYAKVDKNFRLRR